MLTRAQIEQSSKQIDEITILQLLGSLVSSEPYKLSGDFYSDLETRIRNAAFENAQVFNAANLIFESKGDEGTIGISPTNSNFGKDYNVERDRNKLAEYLLGVIYKSVPNRFDGSSVVPVRWVW